MERFKRERNIDIKPRTMVALGAEETGASTGLGLLDIPMSPGQEEIDVLLSM